jgi:hypothetical protein
MRTRRLLASLGLALLPFAALAQTGPPRLSPKATVSQVVGLTEIAITYGRPAVKGREIWGTLVPYGQVWRTGANEATVFSVSTDVKVEGKPLAAGKYGFFTIPNKDHWTLVFSKTWDQWGAFDYKQADDVLRVDVKPVQSNQQERMEFLVDEFNDNSADIVLRWEDVAVPFTVTVDTPKVALAKAESELAGTPKTSALTSWSRWFLEHDSETAKALAWARQAAKGEGAGYWTQATLARLEAKSGHVAEARAAAQKAIAAAPTDKGEGVKDDAKKLASELAGWKA